MKTAEEWMNGFGKFPNDNKQENEIYRLAKLPENLLPPVAFWNSVLTELDIRAIQIDALEHALNLCVAYTSDTDPFSMGKLEGLDLCRNNIQAEIQKLKEGK